MTDTLVEFNAFHNSNPQIYEAFAKITRREIAIIKRAKGKLRLSASSIIAEVRNDRTIKSTTMRTTGRKIDNNYNSYYARLFMTNNPEFAGLFRTRTIKSSEKAVDLFGEKGRGHIPKSDHY